MLLCGGFAETNTSKQLWWISKKKVAWWSHLCLVGKGLQSSGAGVLPVSHNRCICLSKTKCVDILVTLAWQLSFFGLQWGDSRTCHYSASTYGSLDPSFHTHHQSGVALANHCWLNWSQCPRLSLLATSPWLMTIDIMFSQKSWCQSWRAACIHESRDRLDEGGREWRSQNKSSDLLS